MDKFRFENGTVLVGFELPATVPAETVSVCGDFNGWEPEAHPLARLGDGRFRAEIVLPGGHSRRFRYLLDGERWQNDPAADDYVPNGMGTDDSVVDLTDSAALPVVGTASVFEEPGTEPGAREQPLQESWTAPLRSGNGHGGGSQPRPEVQQVRLQQKTWQRIEIEAATRGIESQEFVSHLLEAAMSPRLWPTVTQLVRP